MERKEGFEIEKDFISQKVEREDEYETHFENKFLGGKKMSKFGTKHFSLPLFDPILALNLLFLKNS